MGKADKQNANTERPNTKAERREACSNYLEIGQKRATPSNQGAETKSVLSANKKSSLLFRNKSKKVSKNSSVISKADLTFISNRGE